jgi:hypothetical protein
MGKEKHIYVLKRGVEAWNEWQRENPVVRPELQGGDFHKLDLSGAILVEANLCGADLSSAKLKEVELSRADLTGANLCKADLRGANLKEAFLIDTNLSRANLSEANLKGANLTGADLTGAILKKASLPEATLLKSVLVKTDFSNAILCGANIRWVDFTGSKLTSANLIGAQLVGTILNAADLNNCRIYGISAWDLRIDDKTQQQNLVITPSDQPVIMVDNIEIAQFIYLLLKHRNLGHVFNSITERGVLILGRFRNGGIEVLRAIAEKLREKKYLPILFDFERPRDRTYTETIKTLAGLSRFVVVDITGPSVPQELGATVPHFKIPFVPILEKGKRAYAMFKDILEHDWVLKPIVEFDNTESLIKNLELKIINPAEKRLKKRQKLLNKLFGK